MKIGILTQPIHWNYGGILQNWALQQVLIHLGHKPIKLERSSKWYYPSIYRAILANLKTCTLCIFHKGKNRKFVKISFFGARSLSLIGLKLNKTKPIFTKEDLLKQSKSVDGFIVGSDQVWREDYSPEINDFFFGFLPDDDKRPRISYAASFGKSSDYISEEKLPRCKELLKKFTAVSLRENEGKNILEKDFGIKESELVLDPTLLLRAEDYKKIMCKPKSKTPYISVYILDPSKEKTDVFNEASHFFKDCRIDLIGAKFERYPEARVPSIGSWIRSIADSEAVITDSFHGMVFSLIFHKPFWVIGNINRGIDRYRTLLEPLGLINRLIINGRITDYSNSNSIDWDKVDSWLDMQRDISIDFLKNTLS